MDYHHANLCCVLKVDTRCEACKKHTMEVLGSIDGVYDVTIDAESKTARITGQVHPNFCIRALARCGVHAEVLWANISHPRATRYKSSSSYYNNGAYYCNKPFNFGYRKSLPEGMWHEGYVGNYKYPMRSALPNYSDYGYDASRQHVPLYHNYHAGYYA